MLRRSIILAVASGCLLLACAQASVTDDGGPAASSSSTAAVGGSGAAGGAGSASGGYGADGGGGATSGGSGGMPSGAGGMGGNPGPPPPELVAWYRFEDASLPQVQDSSLYGHHGTPNAGVLRGVGGRFGAGVRFDGMTSNIDIPHTAMLDITGPITIEAWVFLDAPVSNNRMLVRKALQYQMSISVVPDPNLLEFYSQPLGFARTSTADPVEFAHWVHVAVSHDGNDARLYFDGELSATVPLPGMLPSNTNAIKLGGDGFNTNAPDGGMDEVRIWNVIRSEQQICEDGFGSYNSNGSPKCSYP